MRVVANVLSGLEKPNQVVYLDTQGKQKILKLVEESISKPEQVILCLAMNVDEFKIKTPGDYITLTEWLDQFGVELDKRAKHKLAHIITKAYTEFYQAIPKTVTRPDAQGNWTKKANGFLPGELWVLAESLTQVEHSTRPEYPRIPKYPKPKL